MPLNPAMSLYFCGAISKSCNMWQQDRELALHTVFLLKLLRKTIWDKPTEAFVTQRGIQLIGGAKNTSMRGKWQKQTNEPLYTHKKLQGTCDNNRCTWLSSLSMLASSLLRMNFFWKSMLRSSLMCSENLCSGLYNQKKQTLWRTKSILLNMSSFHTWIQDKNFGRIWERNCCPKL